MQIIIRVMIPVLLPIVLGFLLSNINKSNNKEIIKNLQQEHIVVRLPRMYLWVGCLDILIFGTFIFLMILFPNETAAIWVWVGFSLFVFVGIIIVAKTLIWKIDVFRSENYFLCRTLFCKTYKILYHNCVSYSLRENTLVLNTRERKFRIDTHAMNLEFLLLMLTQYEIPQI